MSCFVGDGSVGWGIGVNNCGSSSLDDPCSGLSLGSSFFGGFPQENSTRNWVDGASELGGSGSLLGSVELLNV